MGADIRGGEPERARTRQGAGVCLVRFREGGVHENGAQPPWPSLGKGEKGIKEDLGAVSGEKPLIRACLEGLR